MTLHFAYGANMSRKVMRRHAPGAQPVGAAQLAGYRFFITADGYASVAPCPAEVVHGVVWRLTARDRVTLDAWENVAAGLYHARTIPVRVQGRQALALVYLARPGGEGRAKPGYMELVIAAAREWDLPDAYLQALECWRPAGQPGRPSKVRGACGQDRRIWMSNLIRHIIVRGRVQGVGYRAFVADEAMNRRLEGWVRNRRDGMVEAVFAGPAEMVEPMVEACRKGPWGARVDGLDAREASSDQLALRHPGEAFSVLPTV